MGVRNPALEKALKDCKTKKMHFAFVPKGAEGQLIVAKKKPPEKDVAEVKKEIGGGTVIRGKVSGPIGAIIFEVAKEQAGSFKNALKIVAKRETGLTIVPDIQVKTDAEDEEVGTGETETTETGQAPPEAPPTPPEPEQPDLKSEVMKRLASLAEAFKAALALNSPETGEMNTLMGSIKDWLKNSNFSEAAKALETLEKLVEKAKAWQQEQAQKVETKKTEVNTQIADLEKDPKKAANIAPKIANAKTKVTEAVAKADPPACDYAGALTALGQVDALITEMKGMLDEYQKVLDKKADTDTKIKRLEDHEKKDLISGEIATVKSEAATALALADPPGNDYNGAIKALGAVDKKCGAAEGKIFEKLMEGKNRTQMKDEMVKVFKDRFGVDLTMYTGLTGGGTDTQEQELASMKRVYELMAQVPESHATNNPSLKKVERIGGPSKTSYYEDKDSAGTTQKRVVLHCGRPTTTGTTLGAGLKNSAGEYDPPIEEDCKPREGATEQQSYFDWTTLHEIAHAIDDKKGFMNANGATAAFGGWAEYKSDVSVPAQAAADHFDFKTPEALTYIKGLMQGAANSRPATKPPAPTGRADWAAVQAKVENWVDSIREGKDPWKNMPLALDSDKRIYHEAYANTWVSYLKAARAQGIKGYQFRAPGEFFSELYAAYHCGVLKDSHPMVKKFLRDL